MRRWVFAFLLLVVPLQMVWGAAAAYCGHETNAEAKKHFGHHEHRHQAGGAVTPAAEDDGGISGAYHADCESCHLGSCLSLPVVAIEQPAVPHDPVRSDHRPSYTSHVPSGPERPDRIEPTTAARFDGGVAFDRLRA